MRYTITIVLLCILKVCHAQMLTINNAESGLPIEYATVTDLNFSIIATSNAKGTVNISPFKEVDSIQIRMLGYSTLTTSYQKLCQEEGVISLKPEGFSLNQLVVSATRSNTLKKDIPAKIVFINRQQTLFQNPQTQADLLGMTGNIFIQKSQMGGGSPMIRGFSANRLMYAVDGIRINNAIFRGGNLHNVISLDPLATQNIETLLGAGSVMYGSDAIGGVMNFKSLSPHFSANNTVNFSGNTLLRTSSANFEKTAHADVSLGFKKLAFLSSLTFTDYDDLRMGSNGPEDYLRYDYVEQINQQDVVLRNTNPTVQTPSAYRQINALQKISYKASKSLTIDYAFHYSRIGDSPRYDRLIQKNGDLPKYAEWYYGPQLWNMNSFNIQHHSSNILYDALSLKMAYQYFKESRISRQFNNSAKYIKEEQVDAYSFNLDIKKKVGTHHTIFYGLEGIMNDVKSDAFLENIDESTLSKSLPRYPNASWFSSGLFISDQFLLSRKLTILSGIRYNSVYTHADFPEQYTFIQNSSATLKNSALTGNLGLVYKPDSNWRIRLNSSTGFRAPNVDDFGKVFDSEPGAVTVPNQDLQPEYAYNLELGIAHYVNSNFEFEVSTYYTWLNNALVRRDFQINGLNSISYEGQMSKVQAMQNAAMAQVYGIEMEFEANLTPILTLSSRINYQKGFEELDDGSRSSLRHAAPLFGNIHLIHAKRKLRLDLYGVFNGAKTYKNLAEEERGKPHLYAKDKDGNPWSPAWITANIKAQYTLGSHFSISMGIENIFDTRYRPYSSGITAPGRNFMATIKSSF